MLLSPQFTFLLGEDRTPVTVHASVMASLSGPFDRLINGPMKEAQEKCAELPHVEKEIFLRLIEFAYRGDYTVRPCPDDPKVEEDLKELELDVKIEAAEATKDIVENDLRERRIPDFGMRWKSKEYPPFQGTYRQETLVSSFPDRSLGPRNYSHEAYFLLHAKVYCLADYYIVPVLKQLALHKLHYGLRECTSRVDPCKTLPDDVVALLNYVYSTENIQDRDENGPLDALRQEVLGFTYHRLEIIEDNVSFRKLLQGGGQLPVDLVLCLNCAHRDQEEDENTDFKPECEGPCCRTLGSLRCDAASDRGSD
jgi:hypothetical protein